MTEQDISVLDSLLNQQTNRERQLMLPGVDAVLVTVRFYEEGFRRDPGNQEAGSGGIRFY